MKNKILPALILSLLLLAGCGENASAGTPSAPPEGSPAQSAAPESEAPVESEAPEQENGEFEPIEITSLLPYRYDLDGDGNEETIDFAPADSSVDYSPFVFSIEGQNERYTCETYISWFGSVWLADIDSDGAPELFVSGDEASDDYITYCWRYDGSVQPLSFAGDTSWEYASGARYVEGSIAGFDGGRLDISSFVYMLGTYGGTRTYEYSDGEIAPSGDGIWTLKTDFWLETKLEIPVTMDSGTEAVLPAGTKLKADASDGTSLFWFTLENGERGSIAVSKNDKFWGWLINGVEETEYFVSEPYAG